MPSWLVWLGLVLLAARAGLAQDASRPVVLQGQHRLGVGDVLLVMVDGQPELSGPFTISPDGTILMPLVKRVRAAGRTTAELEKEITERLGKDYLVDPKVAVGIREQNSRRVYLMLGEGSAVSRPIGVRGTLSELLLEAGVSVSILANGEATVIRQKRGNPGEPPSSRPVATVNLVRLLQERDATSDFMLEPGDVIRVDGMFVYLLVQRDLMSSGVSGMRYQAGAELPRRVWGLDMSAVSVGQFDRFVKIKHPLGHAGRLSKVLLDADVPAATFETSVAVVSRTEEIEARENRRTVRAEGVTTAVVDLYPLMFELDRTHDVMLRPDDLVCVLHSRKVRDRGYVYVLGDVQRPGMYACRRQVDARALVALASGRDAAPVRKLIIVRSTSTDGEGEERGHQLIESRPLNASEFLVHAGDTVYVPPAPDAEGAGRIHVLGSVSAPGAFPHEKDMMLGDALERAGGLDGVGSLGTIVVKRPSGTAVRTAACLLRDVLDQRYRGRGPALQPGDIVIVRP